MKGKFEVSDDTKPSSKTVSKSRRPFQRLQFMLETKPVEATKTKSRWDRFVESAPIIGTIVTLIVAGITLNTNLMVQQALNASSEKNKQSDVNLRLVEVAVDILKTDPTKNNKPLREWAITVVEKHFDVPFSAAAQNSLLQREPLLSAASASAVEIPNPFIAGMELATDGSKSLGLVYPFDHQDGTSLTNADGTALDANVIPYITLPPNSNVSLGDFCVVYEVKTGKAAFAIVADFGPRGKYGEGSIALHRALGYERVRSNLTVMDANIDGPIAYLLFRSSGNGKGRDVATIQSEGKRLFQQSGGVDALKKKLINAPDLTKRGVIRVSVQ